MSKAMTSEMLAARDRVHQIKTRKAEVKDPDAIYLEPEVDASLGRTRQWCEDPVEDDWTEYVRADVVERWRESHEIVKQVMRQLADELFDKGQE